MCIIATLSFAVGIAAFIFTIRVYRRVGKIETARHNEIITLQNEIITLQRGLKESQDKTNALLVEKYNDKSIQNLTPEEKAEVRSAVETITDPETADDFFLKAYAAQIDGHHDTAIKHYKKVIELEPESPVAYYNMGNAYANKQDYDKAIECYEKAIELNPDLAEAYYNMGYIYDDKQDYDKAIECYEKAIELKPCYADAYYNMGVAYLLKGDDETAIKCIKKAAELGDEDARKWLDDNDININ